MSVKEYRERIEREVEEARSEPAPESSRLIRELLARSSAPGPGPLAARALDADLPETPPAHEVALERLADPDESAEARRLALQIAKQEAISHPAFDEWRPRYLEALRSAARTADAETRKAALETLAQHRDPYVQQMLLDGLRDPGRALVPVEDALYLLSHDVHAEVHEIAAAVAEDPPSDRARREALRILASDPGYAGRFAELFADPEEDAKVRQLSATALSSLDPERFRDVARGVVETEPAMGAERRSFPLEGAPREAGDDDIRLHTRMLLRLVE